MSDGNRSRTGRRGSGPSGRGRCARGPSLALARRATLDNGLSQGQLPTMWSTRFVSAALTAVGLGPLFCFDNALKALRR